MSTRSLYKRQDSTWWFYLVILLAKTSRRKRITFFHLRFRSREKRIWRSVRCPSANCTFQNTRFLLLLVLIFINMDNVAICFLSLLLSYFRSVLVWNDFVNNDNDKLHLKNHFMNVTSVQNVDQCHCTHSSGNLQLVHRHLTDLSTHFSWKRSLQRKNVILFFRPIFACEITTRSLVLWFRRYPVYYTHRNEIKDSGIKMMG